MRSRFPSVPCISRVLCRALRLLAVSAVFTVVMDRFSVIISGVFTVARTRRIGDYDVTMQCSMLLIFFCDECSVSVSICFSWSTWTRGIGTSKAMLQAHEDCRWMEHPLGMASQELGPYCISCILEYHTDLAWCRGRCRVSSDSKINK
jgi:hypothetical protein